MGAVGVVAGFEGVVEVVEAGWGIALVCNGEVVGMRRTVIRINEVVFVVVQGRVAVVAVGVGGGRHCGLVSDAQFSIASFTIIQLTSRWVQWVRRCVLVRTGYYSSSMAQ